MAGWKRVYVADHPFAAAAAAGALRARGIEAMVSGNELWTVAVEMLYSEGAAPAVWVPEASSLDAEQYLADWQAAAEDTATTHCAGCGAEVPANFASCWRCGRATAAPAP